MVIKQTVVSYGCSFVKTLSDYFLCVQNSDKTWSHDHEMLQTIINIAVLPNAQTLVMWLKEAQLSELQVINPLFRVGCNFKLFAKQLVVNWELPVSFHISIQTIFICPITIHQVICISFSQACETNTELLLEWQRHSLTKCQFVWKSLHNPALLYCFLLQQIYFVLPLLEN